MRVRFALIAVAFAVLVVAGVPLDRTAAAPQIRSGSSSELAAQPAPEPESVAMVRAATTTSTAAQTMADEGSRRDLRPAGDVSIAVRTTAFQLNDDASTPRTFPLLI